MFYLNHTQSHSRLTMSTTYGGYDDDDMMLKLLIKNA